VDTAAVPTFLQGVDRDTLTARLLNHSQTDGAKSLPPGALKAVTRLIISGYRLKEPFKDPTKS